MKRKIWIAVAVVVLIAILVHCIVELKDVIQFQLIFPMGIDEEQSFSDDQRSVLWPMLISVIITMLGSLLTSYIFSKESLDRTADEKVYSRTVIQQYRKKQKKDMIRFALGTVVLIGASIFLYYMFYYWKIRFSPVIREILLALFSIGFGYSIYVLSCCINMEKGILRTALAIKKNLIEEMEKDTNIHSIWNDLSKKEEGQLKQWSQIYDEEQRQVNLNSYVHFFDDYEKILLLLISQESEGQELDEDTLQDVIDKAQIKKILKYEQEDYNKNWGQCPEEQWINDLKQGYKNLSKYGILYRSYVCLSKMRDTVKIMTELDPINNDQFSIEEKNYIYEFFIVFLWVISSFIFPVLPRVKVFLPAHFFLQSNFYNVKFEDSSFKSSAFQESVFSRSGFYNVNFGMVKFDHCTFFGSLAFDCAITNALFLNCNLKNINFSNIDCSGSILEKCCFGHSILKDALLLNIRCTEIDFSNDENRFLNSQISNVVLNKIKDNKISKCDFSSCIIHNVEIMCPEKKSSICLERYNNTWVEKQYLYDVSNRNTPCLKSVDADLKKEIKGIIRKYFKKNQGCAAYVVKGGLRQQKTPCRRRLWDFISKNVVLKIDQSTFVHASIQNMFASFINFSECVFTDANMEGILLFSNYMPGCIMLRTNFRRGLFYAVDMNGCVLKEAIMYQAEGSLVNFEDADLMQLHAAETLWSYCSFNRSDCSKIDLTNSLVRNCMFADAILTNAELTGTQFENSNFSNCIADHMLASYTKFKNCNLENASLEQSSVNHSVFLNCQFRFTSFYESTILNAEFSNCDFEKSDFHGTCFIKARFLGNKNLTVNSFENAKFIKPVFEGSDAGFLEALKAETSIRIIW